MRKFLAICTSGLLLCAMPLPELSVRAEKLTGQCGDDITFTLEDGVLTLTGTGETDNYLTEYIYPEDTHIFYPPNYAPKYSTDFNDDYSISPEYIYNDEGERIGPEEETPEQRERRHSDRFEYQWYSTAPWSAELDSIQTIRIGEGITSLGSALFTHCSVKTVELPESLAKIGNEVFENCFELEEITIPDSVTTIGKSCFMRCDALKHIHLPKAMTVVPYGTFHTCFFLDDIDIPESVTEIEPGAFMSCLSLKTLSLPQSLKKIGDVAFCGCRNLQDFEFPDSLESIGELAFCDCAALTAANLPDSITEIGAGAFSSCEKLETFHWPAHLDTIGAQMFERCNISKLEIPPQVSKIEYGAFLGCNISELEIPPQIKVIEEQVFSNCPIRKLTIPETVEKLCDDCFSGTELESVVIPDSVSEIGESVFSYCKNLKTVKFPKNITALPAYLFAQSGITEFTVPETVETIGDKCFEGCYNLEKVVLPEGLKSIEYSAFSNCSKLSRIDFPDSLESLGENAFAGSGLTALNISPKLKEIPRYAFSNTRLEEVTIPETVTALDESCFQNNPRLTQVTLPDTDIIMDSGCFSSCSSLRSVHLSNQCKELPRSCFRQDYSLTELEIPESCTRIGILCFQECIGLRSITIPSGVREIEDEAFSGCLNLKQVTFSDGIQTIGPKAFENVPVKEIVLPDSIETLDPECFLTCKTDQIKLPDKRIKIANNALPESWLKKQTGFVVAGRQLYRYFGDETEITIPKGISVIQTKAFSEAHPVSIILSDTVEEIESRAFNPELEILTVPAPGTEIDLNAFGPKTNLKEIRSDYFTPAHILAVRNQIQFTPLHTEEEGFGKTAVPQYDTEILPFGNSGEIFGAELQLDSWHKAVLLDASKNTQLMSYNINRAWGGSCYGLSAVTVLAKSGLLSPSDLDPDAKTLHDVKPTQQAVELINYYQLLQSAKSSDEEHEILTLSQTNIACEAIRAARDVNNGKSPFIINIRTASGGAHAVVGYGLETGSWNFNGVAYNRRVLLWDSNYSQPNDKVALYINRDTLAMAFPAYGITVGIDHDSPAGAIREVITDLNVINRIPYTDKKPLPGDVDTNNAVTVSDAVLLARYLGEDTDISYCGEYNADLAHKGFLSFADINGIFRLVGTKN